MTDRAAAGRPHHIEHGHLAHCTRLAHDQAAEADDRRTRLPRLIAVSEPAAGPLQRHRLREPIIDDCPRCGWHGYFHTHLATIDGDWSTAVCDNCYADLHPAITISVKYFSVRSPSSRGPIAAIRERTRSDHRYPDIGQEMTWQLQWQHTTLLVDDARGHCSYHITAISRDEAEQITTSLAARYWPPDAAQLPWVRSAYPT